MSRDEQRATQRHLRQLECERVEDEARAIHRAYMTERVPMRVLAERYSLSITTIHRRIQDAHWARERYEQGVTT